MTDTPTDAPIHLPTSGTPAFAWANGMMGVAIFAGSLPATRVAVADMQPLFLTSARASIAAGLALCLLILLRQPRPRRDDLQALVIVAIGVVLGFPLLTALALQFVTAAHSIVFIGLLPLMTALFGAWRGGERPSRPFWAFSVFGALTVSGFALAQGGAGALQGDVLMLGAIVLCGLGYAEGAKLSKTLGGWQVISWALLLSAPVMLPLALWTAPPDLSVIGPAAWVGLAYVSIFSMLIGFVFWYRGLAQGGTAAVGQLQLLQPFLGLMLAWAILGEPVTPAMIAATIVVIACVVGAKRWA
jgi:drug/metabolite transporter (DMT)-like permease